MNTPHPRLFQKLEDKLLDDFFSVYFDQMYKSTHKNGPSLFKDMSFIHIVDALVDAFTPEDIMHLTGKSSGQLKFLYGEFATAQLFDRMNGAVIESTGDLDVMMDNTDISGISADELNLPFDIIYVNFTKKKKIEDEYSPISGAYLSKNIITADQSHMGKIKTMMPHMEIGDKFTILSIAYVFETPNTIHKKSTFYSTNFFLSKEDSNSFISKLSSFVDTNPDFKNWKNIKGFLDLANESIFKTILYMNTKDMRSVAVNELSDFKKKYLSFGKKRADKQAGKFPFKYDRIIVGPESLSVPQGQYGSSSEKTTHWRRGHFRNQRFGEGLKDSHIVWIQPVIVNAAENEVPAPKTYKLKM